MGYSIGEVVKKQASAHTRYAIMKRRGFFLLLPKTAPACVSIQKLI